MCNQHNNERSGDSTREIYQINNWPDSSRFKFALKNVFSNNITCRCKAYCTLRNETKRNRCETKRNETAAKRNETKPLRNETRFQTQFYINDSYLICNMLIHKLTSFFHRNLSDTDHFSRDSWFFPVLENSDPLKKWLSFSMQFQMN